MKKNQNVFFYRNEKGGSPTEDLGIIDLDNEEEEGDLFDVDDEKLPILKNGISLFSFCFSSSVISKSL